MSIAEQVIKALEAMIAPQLNALTERTKSLEEKIDIRFKALEEKINLRFDAVEQRMNLRFDAVEQRFKALDERLALDSRIKALEDKRDAGTEAQQ